MFRALSLPFSYSLSVSLSLPCRVPYEGEKRTEIEDEGSEREMDKRMVLILEPLTLPSRLIPAPFHYRDEPQSFVRGFRPFSYFFYPLAILALSRVTSTIFFSTHDNWPLDSNEFRSVSLEPFANVTRVDLELEIYPGRLLSSFICDIFLATRLRSLTKS